MAELCAIERHDSKGDHQPATVLPTGNPEYVEFQALSEQFQGEALAKLTRRIDWHVLPPLMTIYMFDYVDRANVGNARLFGAEADLGMSGEDWNIGLALAFVTVVLISPWTNILVKKYSARKVLPFMLFGVGVTIIGTGCSSNRTQWFALRLLLGAVEAGIYGGCVYLMTTYYDAERITSRCFYYYLAASGSGAVSGLLAYGIGQLDYTWGYRGWRWVFVLEGFVSCFIAVGTLWWIPKDLEHPSRWLSDHERRFLILRNKFSYGMDKSGNTLGYSWKDYRSAFFCPHVWILGTAWFTYATGVYGYGFTLPTIIFNMGFTAVAAQALSIPPYILAFVAVFTIGKFGHRFKSRIAVMLTFAFISFIGLIICYTTAGKNNLYALTYVGCMICAIGFYPLTPMLTAYFSVQIAGPTKRAAGLAFSGIFSQLGGVLGSNIYLAKQAPTYQLGFGLSFAFILVGNIGLMAFYWWWIGHINAKRAAMTEEEIAAKYTPEELEAMGDKSPYYVYSR